MSELILIYNLEFVEGIIDFIVMSNIESSTNNVLDVFPRSLSQGTSLFALLESMIDL